MVQFSVQYGYCWLFINKIINMKKIKEFFKMPVKDAGFFEYLFATTAVISALPSVICYFILNLLILQPVKGLVKKVWK